MPAKKVLLIDPGNFFSNPQTAHDNFFQQDHNPAVADEINQKALEEFNSLRQKLVASGIHAEVYIPDDGLETPDAVFCNNWFSTHEESTLILYPLKAPNRRLERRGDLINQLKTRYNSCIDLSSNENKNLFLEGTGSLVLDHENKIAFASLSQRTDINVLSDWSKLMNYETVTFISYDADGQVIYHTNVMMCIGTGFAIVCLDAISSKEEKSKVKSKLLQTGKTLIEISIEQVHHFCGNCLALQNDSQINFLVMSENAFQHFSKEQIATIEQYCQIICSDLKTIETFGGGSARCMLAELF